MTRDHQLVLTPSEFRLARNLGYWLSIVCAVVAGLGVLSLLLSLL